MVSAFGATKIEFRGAEASRGRQIPPHTLQAHLENFRNRLAGVSVSGRRLETGWLARNHRFLRLEVLLYKSACEVTDDRAMRRYMQNLRIKKLFSLATRLL